MQNKVVVIGGGAAGAIAAGTAAFRGLDVTLLERNDRIARKIMITGKGRCNLTNNVQSVYEIIDNIPRNGRFLYSAFSQFMPYDTIDFFESLGVKLKVERGNRVFPLSDKSVDVVDALNLFLKKSGVKTKTSRACELIIDEGQVTGVKMANGDIVFADAVIVATGGLSYPKTGSTGDGYYFAKCAGHTIVPPKPSLVALKSSDTFCAQLQGLSLKNISIKVLDNERKEVLYSDFGEMIFTHVGLSGPVILSASSHIRDFNSGKFCVSIDLKPALSLEQLDSRVQRDFLKYSNKDFSNSLFELLPRKMIPVIIKKCGIPTDLKVNQITKEMRKAFTYAIKNFIVTISGFGDINEAIVTSGGVSTDEIDPKTMRSKKVEGLYFAGEVIDVDGYTGGFNLQIAFSTGRLAGNSILEDHRL
ncbi:MAG: NAD(P)/FAD-dependent oxidoreductase [Oscillospiraceae bacterium]|jgi:predicted Rossmann fold flavoprotein|nr:NAD(P)/FAD-dependent oxidoreductase [Oscillospiraceae bacterium]